MLNNEYLLIIQDGNNAKHQNKETDMKIYGRSNSKMMWSEGWLLERDENGTIKRVKRETLKKFKEIYGWYEADPDKFSFIAQK